MKQKESYISCNCKNKCSLYPFLLPILFMIIRFCHDKFIINGKPEESYKILKYNLPYLFYLYLPKVLSIILIPIIKFNTKGEAVTNEKNIIKKKYHLVRENESKRKLLLFFYIISMLEVIQESGDFLLYYYQRIGNAGWLIEKKTGYIIFVPLFCRILLKMDFYRHHILALILGVFGAFIINYIRFYLDFSHTDDFILHLINTLFSALFSLSLVLIKFTMLKYCFLSPYIFLFYDGIFCIINSFICILLEYVIVINIKDDNNSKLNGQNDNYFSNNYAGIFTIFVGQNSDFYIYFFLSFILSFFYYIINALTIYNYSPYLFIILESFLPIDNDFISLLLKEEEDKELYREGNIIPRVLVQFFGNIILFFAAFILNEIIIFNFCGLNNNTFLKISSRGTDDTFVLEEKYIHSESEDAILSENDIKESIN